MDDVFSGFDAALAAEAAPAEATTDAPENETPEADAADAATSDDSTTEVDTPVAGQESSEDAAEGSDSNDSTNAEEEPALDLSPVVDVLRREVPGLMLDDATPEGIGAAFREQYDRADQYGSALSVVADANDKVPGVDAFVREAAATGNPVAAFVKAFPALADVLDPEEGTEAYRALEQERREAAIRAEYDKKDSEKQAATASRWESDAQRAFAAFEASPPVSPVTGEAVDLARFVEWYASMNMPDQTGRFRGDHFTEFAKAFRYDTDVKAATAKGDKAGYERALAEMKAKGLLPEPERKPDGTFARAARASDGVPATRSGGASHTPPPTGFATVRTTPTVEDIYGGA